MRVERYRRIFFVWVALATLIGLLVCRLAWVQLVMKNQKQPGSRHTLLEASLLQRERGLVLDSGRGHFTDRNGYPLTGKLVWAAVLFPVTGDRTIPKDGLFQAARLLNTRPERLKTIWKGLKEPMLWHDEGSAIPLALNDAQRDGIEHLDLPSLQVLPYEQRYGNRESGMQWLGFISGQRKEKLFYRDYEGVKGTSGLERTLDALLQGTGPTVVYFPVDGQNRIINEMRPMVKASTNPFYPLRFTTTVDIRIQTGIEKLMEKAGISEGSVVVQDASNGDILAMVSRPFYNPEQVHPKEGQWGNKALQAATPGSIFKIVTAAAALEAGVASGKEKFHCSGEYGRYGLSCWKTEGHGTINLRQAFAESCNVAFAELAERLSSEQIQDTANKLGLGRSIGWEAHNVLGLPLLKPLDHEQDGTVFLPSTDLKDPGARVQTAIGQRDVSITPLQASNLMVTLLHDGKVFRPRIISGILYANGQRLQSFLPMGVSEAGETISHETFHTLRKWMEDVVRQGTGRSLGRSVWKLAGKTGTAETMVKNIPRNNQWFVGYGPVGQPRYSVAVFVENVKPNSRHLATELFGQVMDLLASTDSSSR